MPAQRRHASINYHCSHFVKEEIYPRLNDNINFLIGKDGLCNRRMQPVYRRRTMEKGIVPCTGAGDGMLYGHNSF